MKTTNPSLIKTIAASAAAMSLAAVAFAGETVRVNPPATTVTEGFYNAHEFQVGFAPLFVARAGQRTPAIRGLGLGAALPVRDRDRDDQVWGADVDLAYFITRNFGVGVEQQWIDDGRPIWNSAFNVILRAPLNESSPWAPYLFGGAGVVYASGQGRVEGHAGAGIEYRFTPRIGTFIDGRYTWVDGRNDRVPQYGAFRAGLRLVF
jgi:hypothetical protein